MILYSTQNYLVFGLCPSSGIQKTKITLQKLDLFLSSGEEGACIMMGPLERAGPVIEVSFLEGPQQSRCLPLTLEQKQI
jgi:hypothetical protein